MILPIIMALVAVKHFKTVQAWRLGYLSLLWLVITSEVSMIFFAGGGTLENPVGDGIITAYVRQQTNNGPEVALLGISVLLFIYAPTLYLYFKALKNKDEKADSNI